MPLQVLERAVERAGSSHLKPWSWTSPLGQHVTRPQPHAAVMLAQQLSFSPTARTFAGASRPQHASPRPPPQWLRTPPLASPLQPGAAEIVTPGSNGGLSVLAAAPGSIGTLQQRTPASNMAARSRGLPAIMANALLQPEIAQPDALAAQHLAPPQSRDPRRQLSRSPAAAQPAHSAEPSGKVVVAGCTTGAAVPAQREAQQTESNFQGQSQSADAEWQAQEPDIPLPDNGDDRRSGSVQPSVDHSQQAEQPPAVSAGTALEYPAPQSQPSGHAAREQRSQVRQTRTCNDFAVICDIFQSTCRRRLCSRACRQVAHSKLHPLVMGPPVCRLGGEVPMHCPSAAADYNLYGKTTENHNAPSNHACPAGSPQRAGSAPWHLARVPCSVPPQQQQSRLPLPRSICLLVCQPFSPNGGKHAPGPRSVLFAPPSELLWQIQT